MHIFIKLNHSFLQSDNSTIVQPYHNTSVKTSFDEKNVSGASLHKTCVMILGCKNWDFYVVARVFFSSMLLCCVLGEKSQPPSPFDIQVTAWLRKSKMFFLILSSARKSKCLENVCFVSNYH